MWMSIEMDATDNKGNSDKLHIEDCAFRIIACRPKTQRRMRRVESYDWIMIEHIATYHFGQSSRSKDFQV
jgi:hypothetical protein